jgi:hypothetical protein
VEYFQRSRTQLIRGSGSYLCRQFRLLNVGGGGGNANALRLPQTEMPLFFYLYGCSPTAVTKSPPGRCTYETPQVHEDLRELRKGRNWMM